MSKNKVKCEHGKYRIEDCEECQDEVLEDYESEINQM